MSRLFPAALAALLIGRALAASDEDARWDSRFALPGVENNALTMAFNHRRVYVGGYMKAAGRAIVHNGVARFDGRHWTALPQGPQFDPQLVSVVAVETFRNRLYVGGSFASVSGRPTCGFARWNGQRWSNPAGTNGMVSCLRSTPEGLLVGGQFEVPGVGKRVSLARYNGRRWTVLMLSTVISDGTHLNTVSQCEQLDSGEIIASDGGRLLRYDGAQWSPLLTPNGSVEGFGTYELTKFQDRFVAFSSEWAGSSAPHAVFSWSGHDWQKLGDDFSEILHAVGNDRVLYAIHRVGPDVFPKSYAVSHWTGTNWQQVGTNLFATDGFARIFIGPGDRPHVSGPFPGFPPVAAAGVIRWNGKQWEPLAKGTYEGVNGIVNSVFAFAKHSDGIYMGGSFLTAGRLFEQGIAHWDGEHWQSVGGGLSGNRSLNLRALHSAGPLLYAAGRFTNIGGITAANVAAWNGTNWFALGAGVASNALALATWNNGLYVGGRFQQAGEIIAQNIAQWNGNTWQALGEGCNSNVSALASWRGELYAGGRFTTAGGTGASLIARWDGSEWHDVAGGLTAATDPDGLTSPDVSALAAAENGLYAAGQFQMAGTIIATNIARWDGTNWHSLGLGFHSPGDAIFALSVRDHILYAGGIWTDNDGKRVALLQRWDGTNWTSLGSGVSDPTSNFGRVYALLATDEELFVGGRFTWAGGKASGSVARWIEKPLRRR